MRTLTVLFAMLATLLACGGLGAEIATDVLDESTVRVQRLEGQPHKQPALAAVETAWLEAKAGRFGFTDAVDLNSAVETAVADGTIDASELSSLQAKAPDSSRVPADKRSDWLTGRELDLKDKAERMAKKEAREAADASSAFGSWSDKVGQLRDRASSLGWKDVDCDTDDDYSSCDGLRDGRWLFVRIDDWQDADSAKDAIDWADEDFEAARVDGRWVMTMSVHDGAAGLPLVRALAPDPTAFATLTSCSALSEPIQAKGWTLQECDMGTDEGVAYVSATFDQGDQKLTAFAYHEGWEDSGWVVESDDVEAEARGPEGSFSIEVVDRDLARKEIEALLSATP